MEEVGSVVPIHRVEINLERLLSRLEEVPPPYDDESSIFIGSGISPEQREALNQLKIEDASRLLSYLEEDQKSQLAVDGSGRSDQMLKILRWKRMIDRLSHRHGRLRQDLLQKRGQAKAKWKGKGKVREESSTLAEDTIGERKEEEEEEIENEEDFVNDDDADSEEEEKPVDVDISTDMGTSLHRESVASSAHGSLLFSRMGHSRRHGELGITDHKKKQELLLQELAKMTKTLRSQTELVGRQLQEDVRILAETEDLTSDNLNRVNLEQTDLSEQVSRSCHENIFLWILLVVLAILFFVTYSFIRVSKR